MPEPPRHDARRLGPRRACARHDRDYGDWRRDTVSDVDIVTGCFLMIDTALWRDLADRRNNSPTRLAEAAKQIDMTVWPAPVIRHFLGQANIEQTYGAAFDTDPKVKAAQTCEANFYSGELALLTKDKKEAQRLLKLAADQCPPSFIESTAAVAELIQLK